MTQKYAKDFGNKEKALNHTAQRFQLTRPSKVGAVMALIRDAQPESLEAWQKYYFQHAKTKTKEPVQVTNDILIELGERLFEKLTEIIIPEWREAFNTITKEDCIKYIQQVTIERTFDGFLTEKSVIYDVLAKEFTDIVFEESDEELDHAGDVDYLGRVGDKAFGIQIKPITNQANFGSYSPTQRMRNSFDAFQKQYGGLVFIVFSSKVNNKKTIQNREIIDEIRAEIERLKSLQ